MSNTETTDQVYRFYSTDLSIRAVFVNTTVATRKVCQQLQTTPSATIGIGRALTGASLLAANLGENQQIGLHFNGDGPIAGIFAEATYEGDVRAWCGNPQVDLKMAQSGHHDQIDIPAAIGAGVLTVTRSVPFEKQPRVSTVPLVSGEIGQDIALYLDQSSQIPSIVSLGVLLDGDGQVQISGGALIEVMPGASENILATLATNSQNAASLSDLLTSGIAPQQIIEAYTGDLELIPSDHSNPIRFKCRCSQERLERSLAMLGGIELEEMISNQKNINASCEFCGHRYEVRHDRLVTLLHEISAQKSPKKKY